ncbi:MAG: asparagine synthase (glutamine-hydrolyzing) [Bacteroidetes bacterium]|jgi:asparagine synthase (glutamine-hydrolysing)|nr:asparagine synthase (glutamine-hydrolyzing) [Bacteroidota bacterium]MBT5990179.1 asparagine synthase (glutamine-hydrolyzing) [Bacteroidota bacterium]MBT7995275.1 asparagine synthase (glutamine-hydrolyzing) [Bacteroidota bacterium]
MSGIVGIINLKSKNTLQAQHIESMNNAIKHRGPDDEGYVLFNNNVQYFFSGNNTPSLKEKITVPDFFPSNNIQEAYELQSQIAFGSRRLNVGVFKSTDHQPMSYKNRYWIVYDGEIFNSEEIKAELFKYGHTFQTTSDTEAIIAAYDQWGIDCFNKFNGNWVFAIYDTEECKIIVSRDRFGMKPLYYYKDDNRFIFASEIKALLCSPDVKSSPNIPYIKDFYANGTKEHLRETSFTNIYRFAISSFIEVSIDELIDGIKEKRFWTAKATLDNEKFDKNKAAIYSTKYNEILSDAVKIRTKDVKVGTTLSGGLDSSTIAYYVDKHLSNENRADDHESFSSVYKGDEKKIWDESEFIDTVVDYLNIKSNRVEPIANDIITDYERVIFSMENPPDSTGMSGWVVYKDMHNKNFKVAIDGVGADGQMGGFFKYFISYIIDAPLVSLLKEYISLNKLPNLNRKKFFFATLINLLKRLLGRKMIVKLFKKYNKKTDLTVPLNQKFLNDTMFTLATPLHYHDSLNMPNSVVSRAPFLDYRLVEFLASIPIVYKIHDGWTKHIARIAMQNKLPDDIVWRKDKLGFANADDYWLRGELKDWCCLKIESSTLLKDMNWGQNILETIEKMPLRKLVRLLNISVWEEVFWNRNKKFIQN